jgi:hypothetical protein
MLRAALNNIVALFIDAMRVQGRIALLSALVLCALSPKQRLVVGCLTWLLVIVPHRKSSLLLVALLLHALPPLIVNATVVL